MHNMASEHWAVLDHLIPSLLGNPSWRAEPTLQQTGFIGSGLVGNECINWVC